jgi:isopenicillin-N epimerase
MQQLRNHFLLRDDITFLNFGSFGACVKPVFERYSAFQLELEQEPIQFITVNGLRYLAESRAALGRYLNCGQDDVVYMTNPSYAVNTVLHSLDLKEGDEILTTDLEYGACDRTLQYYCEKSGAVTVRQPITLPLESKEKCVKEFFGGLSSRTRMVFISHITSTTALRLPVEEICTKARALGLITFVDGAHAPAQVPLDLSNNAFDYYTGACHKWMMTPKGSAFLYVRRPLQQALDPLVISWGWRALFPSDSEFIDYHQMNGTRDFSAFLTIPAAIDFIDAHNWTAVAAQCRTLVKENASELCRLLSAVPLAPLHDDFIGQMFSAEINTAEPEKLQRHLYETYQIEIPVMRHGSKNYLRYSVNAFNTQEELDRLFAALAEIKKNTALIQ